MQAIRVEAMRFAGRILARSAWRATGNGRSMAYLARIESNGSDAFVLPEIASASTAEPDFSDLEWSVIRLARIDALWTIRSAGPIRRFWNRLIGRGNPELANPQLEALRRAAVLSWHYGFDISGYDIADFLAAGFSAAQYELLVTSIIKAADAPLPAQSTKVFA
jgi:hypothetical protein